MTKLFISFTTTIRKIADGSISDADLADGLFYFGCTRGHAREPWKAGPDGNELEWSVKDADRRAEVHRTLLAALDAAEKDGRVLWREPHRHPSFRQLNMLLTGNCLPPVDQIGGSGSYNHMEVADRIVAAGVPLDVVYA